MIELIRSIELAIRRCEDEEEKKFLYFKKNYIIYKDKGAIETLRRDEKTHRIQMRYSCDDQIAIILEGDPGKINALKEFRDKIYKEVDDFIARCEREVEA
jgi:hypothetical protein